LEFRGVAVGLGFEDFFGFGSGGVGLVGTGVVGLGAKEKGAGGMGKEGKEGRNGKGGRGGEGGVVVWGIRTRKYSRTSSPCRGLGWRR